MADNQKPDDPLAELGPKTMAELAIGINEATGDTLTLQGALFAANQWALIAWLLIDDAENPVNLADEDTLRAARQLRHDLNQMVQLVLNDDPTAAWCPDGDQVGLMDPTPPFGSFRLLWDRPRASRSPF